MISSITTFSRTIKCIIRHNRLDAQCCYADAERDIFYCCAECHYAECHYVECRGALTWRSSTTFCFFALLISFQTMVPRLLVENNLTDTLFRRLFLFKDLRSTVDQAFCVSTKCLSIKCLAAENTRSTKRRTFFKIKIHLLSRMGQ
jgi:hypothetical protein